MSSKLSKNIELVFDQGTKLVEFYRKHPVIAAYDLLGVDLAPIQAMILEDMWFKSYVLTVASRGLGKSTYVFETTNFLGIGTVHLSEILPPIPHYLQPGQEEIIDYSIEVQTSHGFRPTKRLCLEKSIPGKKITTRNGFIKRGSSHHPLLIMNAGGELSYKQLHSLEAGDRVCIQRNQFSFGTRDVDADSAYLIGLLIGDGHLVHNTTVTSADETILSFCTQYCLKHGVPFNITVNSNSECTFTFRFSSKFYLLDTLKVHRVLSYDKTVPFSIRTSKKEAYVAFLQGLFDTDGSVEKASGGVSMCSVSRTLVEEVQMMLLNLGIVSRIRTKKTKSNFGKAYELTLFSEDAYKFKEIVGFRLPRKQELLEAYFANNTFNVNKDVIPYIKDKCLSITRDYRSSNSNNIYDRNLPRFDFPYWNSNSTSYNTLHRFITEYNNLSTVYKFSAESEKSVVYLKELMYLNYYFDTVVSVEEWQGDCYDFEMDMPLGVEPNYFSNGFINHNTFLSGVLATLSCLLYPGYRVGIVSSSFRQARLIFSEVEKLYATSEIFREACEKPPVHGSDSYHIKFKGIGGQHGSFLEALPLGQGDKIRGSRFYLLLMDEFAQIPKMIIDTVLTPMAVTKLNPMKKVRELERRKELISQGLAVDSDFEEDTLNKLIAISSGYFKFNHMYKRMREYWRFIDEGSPHYAVHQIPYTMLPEGFLDEINISTARRTMSDYEFRMEYMADMVSDSDGFFKASVIAACSERSGFYTEVRGNSVAKYVLGVDPNQGGAAKCGFVVLKMGTPNKVVLSLEFEGQRTQDIVMRIQKFCKEFNIVFIFMDRGGGGKAVADLLAEGYNDEEPILDTSNETYENMKGRRILESVTFGGSSQWVTEANFTTLAMLENKDVLFPEPPNVATSTDTTELAYEEIEKLKKQCLNIIVTETATGTMHFDTPKKGQNKDLYSAFILACWGVRKLTRPIVEEEEPILYGSAGCIRPKGGQWRAVEGRAKVSQAMLEAAILKKSK